MPGTSLWRKGGRLLSDRLSMLSHSSFVPKQHFRSSLPSPLPYTKQGQSKLSFSSSSPSPSPSPTSSPSVSSSNNALLSWYLGLIESRPIITKSLTAALIFTAADVSSQIITLDPLDSFDPIRTLRMAGFGMLISGPSLHLWFNSISRVLPRRDILTTVKKIFIGQTVYGPIMTVAFFSMNAGLQGETSAEIGARLKRDLIPTFKSGLVYWPMCDFITFKFVPVHLQPLINNSFSFLWTIYITYVAGLKKVPTE